MATGTASVRRRRLPAEQVVWMVLGMALMRNESIDRVVALLDLALPTPDDTTAAKSAIAQARKRLGAEPMGRREGKRGDSVKFFTFLSIVTLPVGARHSDGRRSR